MDDERSCVERRGSRSEVGGTVTTVAMPWELSITCMCMFNRLDRSEND